MPVREAEQVICSHCDTETPEEETHAINDELVCRDCIDENYILCAGCQKFELTRNSRYTEDTDECYCEHCATRHTFTCDRCNCCFTGRNTDFYAVDGCDTWCENCISAYAYFCETCHEHSSDGPCCDDDEDEIPEEIPEDECYRGKITTQGIGHRIGVEIEVSEYSPRDHWKGQELGWSCEPDGTDGVYCEYTSPILFESNYQSEIERFCSTVLPYADVNRSCGLHVHLDASKLSWLGVAKLYRYCQQYQRFIRAMFSPSRRRSSFCVSIPELPPIKRKADLVKFLYGREKGAGCRSHYPSGGIVSRYWWVNIHSYFYRRTVEFRLHSGTTNAEKITNWIKILLCILEDSQRKEPIGFPLCLPTSLLNYYHKRLQHILRTFY